MRVSGPVERERAVHAAGGNSLRVWLFVEGASIPAFDARTGMVVGTDAAANLGGRGGVHRAPLLLVVAILCARRRNA